MRGSCSPKNVSITRVPPISVFISTMPGGLGYSLPDDAGFRSPRIVFAFAPLQRWRSLRYDCDEFAFVRHIKRIETENFTGAADGIADRNLSLIEQHSNL